MTPRFPKTTEFAGTVKAIILVGLVLSGVIAYLLFQTASPVGPIQPGLVESSGWVAVARMSGATRAVAVVRLDDGRVVHARVPLRRLLRKGTRVHVRARARVWGGHVHEVVHQPAPRAPGDQR